MRRILTFVAGSLVAVATVVVSAGHAGATEELPPPPLLEVTIDGTGVTVQVQTEVLNDVPLADRPVRSVSVIVQLLPPLSGPRT